VTGEFGKIVLLMLLERRDVLDAIPYATLDRHSVLTVKPTQLDGQLRVEWIKSRLKVEREFFSKLT